MEENLSQMCERINALSLQCSLLQRELSLQSQTIRRLFIALGLVFVMTGSSNLGDRNQQRILDILLSLLGGGSVVYGAVHKRDEVSE